jgi:RNA polymerase sigma-70 factor, ECF subfamily
LVGSYRAQRDSTPNEAIDAVGRFDRGLDQEDGKFANSWNEQFQQHIFATALERSKVHFNEETWKMFEMSWLQKMEVEQVSQVLGVSIDRIYVARSRVLKRLRYEVATLADDIS